MRRIVLSILLVGALAATSCKGEKKDAVKEVVTEVKSNAVETKEKVSNMVESALEGISIPSFKNTEVTEHLKSYASYAKEYIAAGGDVVKNSDLAKKGVALTKKGKELLSTLDEEATKKFKSVMNAIQSKMAPAK